MTERGKHVRREIDWSLQAVIGTMLTAIAAIASVFFAPLSGYTLVVLILACLSAECTFQAIKRSS